MKIRPLHDILIVKCDKQPKLSSVLEIPGHIENKPEHGVVLAAGPGTYNKKGRFHPTTIKVGDRVLFSKLSGTLTKIDGQEVFFLKETEIIGIIGE